MTELQLCDSTTCLFTCLSTSGASDSLGDGISHLDFTGECPGEVCLPSFLLLLPSSWSVLVVAADY